MMLTRLYHALQDRIRPLPEPRGTSVHLQAALDWLKRAQDATSDRGVSHSYGIGKGWAPSYPETTGYIIPTLLNWHWLTGDAESRRRALEMAEWETSIQLEDGAVTGCAVGSPDPRPVVFDTGQVLFGWVSAYRATSDPKHLASARKAADWLVAHLDGRGTWSTYGNMGKDTAHTYNARVAWAVFEFARVTGEAGYTEAMRPFLKWALEQEESDGWFGLNCLNDNERPLLHTIAYTAQGLLESGIAASDTPSVDAATRTADALLAHVGSDGRMPGRFLRGWRPAVAWSCLTGIAQMAIVWQRLHHLAGGIRYREAALAANRFLKRTQDLSTGNDGIRGGIKGSFPSNGQYGRFRVLNWAVKFFADSLLLEDRPAAQAAREYYQG